MPDYQKGKIYKLYSPSKNLVYYGSTCETLPQRLAKHKYANKVYNEGNTQHYCSSYLIFECEDYKMELVEEYPSNNKQQLLKKEAEYIKANQCVNPQIPGRTKQEWEQDNKERLAIKSKEYTKNNPEVNKQAAKKYYENNKEKINERRREYRLKKKQEQVKI
jgi:hypothetical protein